MHAEDEVRITCSDNGCGIDPAIQARVFEPFVTTRRMLGGSGLGLHIVNQIVTRQLNGTITMHIERTRDAFCHAVPTARTTLAGRDARPCHPNRKPR